MLIKEICNLTGLTKKAICYYERQGLLKPRKGINGYREYSQTDIVLLNEISFLLKKNYLELFLVELESI